MGYPTLQNFDIVFIRRTIDNLDRYDGENDFSMLLNSLLGLILLPNEYNIKEKRKFSFEFLNQSIDNFSEIRSIFNTSEIEFSCDGERSSLRNKFSWLTRSKNEILITKITLGQFLRRLRNGIAHFGIIPTKNGEDWEGVIIRNHSKDSRGVLFCDFEIYFKKNELKTFAKFIGKKYIDTVKPS